jgi:metal-responsive CopG/Arc/MetJ family transcriptional regulator
MLLNMKTAISLSNSLFEKVKKTARYMGIPRSRLFVIALEDYIVKHNEEMITKKLNEVYEKVNQDEFSKDLDIGLESLRKLTKNDTW